MAQWFENPDFWLDYGPIMFDQSRWAEAPGVALAIRDMCGLKEGDFLLDAGCGPGRLSVELALLGLNVTGVDLIRQNLDAAAETACAEDVALTLIQADLRSFKSKTSFDAAINVYTSFGYCDSIEEDISILRAICGSLRPGGAFVLECVSRESAIRYFTEGEWFERAGMTCLTQFSVEGAWEGLRSKWTLIDKQGRRREHEFVQRLYSAADLRGILLRAGFSRAQVYGGYDLRPYDQNLSTMVILARK